MMDPSPTQMSRYRALIRYRRNVETSVIARLSLQADCAERSCGGTRARDPCTWRSPYVGAGWKILPELLEAHPRHDLREPRVVPQRIVQQIEEILRDVEVFFVDAPVEPFDPAPHVTHAGIHDCNRRGGDQLPRRPTLQVGEDVPRRRPIARDAVGEPERRGGLGIECSQVERALERRDRLGVAALLDLD